MGCWSVSCGISNIAITYGNDCVLLPLKKNTGNSEREYQAATLTIFGQYNDYGGIENIIEDDNTKLIEEHLGITKDEFATFLLDGKFTYERDESKKVKLKLDESDKLKEVEEWRFMWIDRKVYDFMIINQTTDFYLGYNDFGTKKMLELFGFEFISEKDNKQIWKKGDVEMYSDSSTLKSKDGNLVYHFGHGDETSLETYFDVPEELNYLKNKTKRDTWRLMSPRKAKDELSFILANRYDFQSNMFMMLDDYVIRKKRGSKEEKNLHMKYYADLETWGDRIAELCNVWENLHPMSAEFTPAKLYLTPQCGDYDTHQKMLDKFSEINQSYINKYD